MISRLMARMKAEGSRATAALGPRLVIHLDQIEPSGRAAGPLVLRERAGFIGEAI